MKGYLLGAAGVIFLSVIVSLLVPEGKLNKTITFVVRLICIFVLIQPVIGIFKISETPTSGEIFDSSYVCEEYSDHQSSQLEILLYDKFSAQTECDVEVEYENGGFEVKNVEVAVNEGDENLIEKIYAYLSEVGYINISVYAKNS